MKFYLILIISLGLSVVSFSQKKEDKDHSFKQENIFIGGSIGLGAGSGSFSVGGNPEIGYTIADWLDAGISANINYYTISPEYNNGYRGKSFNYGGGIFARFYPIQELFVQILPEYNHVKLSEKAVTFNYYQEESYEAPSLLLGIGYTTREIHNSNFYTIIMFDAGTNTHSPYIGSLGSKFPILRAGLNFYLRPKRK